jgi:hypothetical protein
MLCRIPDRDLQQKLNGTVCMYDRKPVWVEVQGATIIISDLPGGDNRRSIKATDPLFDISTPPLGYCDGDRVLYLTRIPLRRSVQALSPRALKAERLPIGFNQQRDERAAGERIFYTRGFVDMTMNKYRSLDDTLKYLRGKIINHPEEMLDAAVSRNIALQINKLGIIHVFYKQDLVGWIAPNDITVNVKSDDKGWIVSRYLSHGLTWEIK